MLKRLAFVFVAWILLGANGGFAAGYPDKPVRIIVPFAPGGGVDVIGRILAQHLSQKWGEQAIVENRPGAGGGVGAQYVAQAQPDGYTLLFVADTALSFSPILQPNLSYDPLSSFAPISQVTNGAILIAANPKLGVNTLQELVALAQSKPGKLNYGSAGIGTLNNLAMELFKQTAGINIVHVPYRGAGPATVAALSGQVEVAAVSPSSMMAYVKSGAVRALAVTSAERAAALPDVPTVQEMGYPGFAVTGWYGLLAPAKTSPAIVDKINSDVREVLKQSNVQAEVNRQGLEVAGTTSADFTRRIKSDVEKWKKLVKQGALGIERH